jgi:hypothetical protein
MMSKCYISPKRPAGVKTEKNLWKRELNLSYPNSLLGSMWWSRRSRENVRTMCAT